MRRFSAFEQFNVNLDFYKIAPKTLAIPNQGLSAVEVYGTVLEHGCHTTQSQEQ